MNQAIAEPVPPGQLADLLDREQVIDALLRFAAGQDLRDAGLFLSAWTPDAELDFTQPAALLGVELAPFRGREQILAIVMGSTEPLVTSHTVTNMRVQVHGDDASLSALVEAQHIARADPATHLLLKNLYQCELQRDGPVWRIRRMGIRNLWLRGDPTVLFPT